MALSADTPSLRGLGQRDALALRGVRVTAGGRLHLGFLDPSATLGRRFGSLGLAIDGLQTVLEMRPAAHDSLAADPPASAGPHDSAANLERLAAGLARLREQTGLMQPLALRLRDALPDHAGFGSGTQLALALGRAFAAVHGLELPTATLARWLGRGLRSGIGIAGFDHGGLLVDGGPSADGSPAPPLSRIELPEAWRVVLVIDPRRRGLSGDEERAAIARLPALSREQSADVCHHVLMAVLPGAATGDFTAFAHGVNRVQQVLGGHFAPAQGGTPWTSPAVGRVFEAWQSRDPEGIAFGQTSWGPTGFAVVPSAGAAQQGLEALQAAGAIDAALQVRVVSPCHRGASVDVPPEAP